MKNTETVQKKALSKKISIFFRIGRFFRINYARLRAIFNVDKHKPLIPYTIVASEVQNSEAQNDSEISFKRSKSALERSQERKSATVVKLGRPKQEVAAKLAAVPSEPKLGIENSCAIQKPSHAADVVNKRSAAPINSQATMIQR